MRDLVVNNYKEVIEFKESKGFDIDSLIDALQEIKYQIGKHKFKTTQVGIHVNGVIISDLKSVEYGIKYGDVNNANVITFNG